MDKDIISFIFNIVLGMSVYHLLTIAGLTLINPYWYSHINYNYSLSVTEPHDNIYCVKLSNGYECRIFIDSDNVTLGEFMATGSMLPLLAGNSTTINVPIHSMDDLHIGDLVCYLDIDYMVVCHRVIEIHGDYIIAKGDNSYAVDKVYQDQLVSKIIAIVN